MNDTQNHFPSPFTQHLGIEIVSWQENKVELSATIEDEFVNSHGVPHGGFLCSLLDVGTSLPGIYCPTPGHMRKALTLSLNTNFVGQASSKQLYITGRVIKSGFKIYYSSAEIFDANDQLLATAQAVLKYTKGSETLTGIPT